MKNFSLIFSLANRAAADLCKLHNSCYNRSEGFSQDGAQSTCFYSWAQGELTGAPGYSFSAVLGSAQHAESLGECRGDAWERGRRARKGEEKEREKAPEP